MGRPTMPVAETPYVVMCQGTPSWGSCGRVGLSRQEYERQLLRADDLWCCPHCGGMAEWDERHCENWFMSVGTPTEEP